MEQYLPFAGVVFQTVIFLLGGYALYVKNNTSQKIHTDGLREEVRGMKEELKALADVITVQAVQSTRIDNLYSQVLSIERRVEDMRRGDGYVTGKRRGNLEGEYPSRD